MPDQTQKPTHEQLVCDSLKRRRKPLIDLTSTDASKALKAKDEIIENQSRQIAQLQASITGKESYILELEGKLADALEKINATKPPIAPAPPSTPASRRQAKAAEKAAEVKTAPASEVIQQPDKPDEEQKAPEVLEAPKAPVLQQQEAPKPGEGYTEDDS